MGFWPLKVIIIIIGLFFNMIIEEITHAQFSLENPIFTQGLD